MDHYLNKYADAIYEDHLINAKDTYENEQEIIFMAHWMCIIDSKIAISDAIKEKKQTKRVHYENLLFVFRSRLFNWCRKTKFKDL